MWGVNDVYTHGHHGSVLRSHRWRTAENSARYLLDHLAPHMSLLDVGCGPATITCDLSGLVAWVVGIEPNEGILREAEETRRQRNADNVSFEVGSVEALAFTDGSFDVTHAHQVLQHLSDPVAALREMARVTTSGGLVAVRDADYHAMSWYPELPGLDEWMGMYQAVARRNGAEPDAARRLLSWAAAAGLDDLDATVDSWLFYTSEDRRWWGGLWAQRCTQSALAHQAIEYGIATGPDLSRIAAAWTEWSEHPQAWFVVPNGELIARPP